MKKLLLIILALGVGVTSCKKEEQTPEYNKELAGKTFIEEFTWENAFGLRVAYRVLEFKSNSEVHFSTRSKISEEAETIHRLKWEATGITGTQIIIHFVDGPSEGNITDNILSFRNPTRVYLLQR